MNQPGVPPPRRQQQGSHPCRPRSGHLSLTVSKCSMPTGRPFLPVRFKLDTQGPSSRGPRERGLPLPRSAVVRDRMHLNITYYSYNPSTGGAPSSNFLEMIATISRFVPFQANNFKQSCPRRCRLSGSDLLLLGTADHVGHEFSAKIRLSTNKRETLHRVGRSPVRVLTRASYG